MVEKTVHQSELDRSSVAESLRSLADEFESSEDVHIRVGNKSVRLHPPEAINYEVSVHETSSIIRSSRETVTLTLDWKTR
jgi:amphi-Trp domain-containing protein